MLVDSLVRFWSEHEKKGHYSQCKYRIFATPKHLQHEVTQEIVCIRSNWKSLVLGFAFFLSIYLVFLSTFVFSV